MYLHILLHPRIKADSCCSQTPFRSGRLGLWGSWCTPFLLWGVCLASVFCVTVPNPNQQHFAGMGRASAFFAKRQQVLFLIHRRSTRSCTALHRRALASVGQTACRRELSCTTRALRPRLGPCCY